MGLFQQASDVYLALLRFIESGWQNDTTNEIVCRYKLMKTYFDDRRFDSALGQCDEILDRDLDPRFTDGLRSRMKSTRRYRERCLDEIGQRRVP